MIVSVCKDPTSIAATCKTPVAKTSTCLTPAAVNSLCLTDPPPPPPPATIVVNDPDGNDLCGGTVNFHPTAGGVSDYTFSIVNNSEGTLTLGSIEVTGDGYSLLTNPPSSVLAPTESTSFVVRFDPTGLVEGTFAGVVSIPSNSTDSPCLVNSSTIFSIPLIDLACSSESGHATLCGWPEFTDESSPPRFYLRLTNTGSTRETTYQTATDCTGTIIGDSEVLYSGAGIYDPTNCTLDCSSIVNGTCGAVNTGGFRDRITTKTTSSSVGQGCIQFSPIQSRDFSGTWTNVLSDEDTETAGILRADKTPGTSCTAAIEPRGSGEKEFDFVVVALDFSCTNLIAGLAYRASVEMVLEDYGGGSPVVQTLHYDFIASGPTHDIADVINCPSGKQVTAQNESINFQ